MASLRQIEAGAGLPEALLCRRAGELFEVLEGPTLIHIDGQRPEPLFVSCLLHGNEPVGWEALRRLLAGHAGRPLPRALSVLVGNVEAAAHNRRRLPGQPDFNRVWPDADGTPAGDSQPARLLAEVTAEMKRRGLTAAIDVHNNTGANPPYACVNECSPAALALSGAFAELALYFDYPRGVQTMAFTGHCPAVTIECGQPGWVPGEIRAARFIERCLREGPPAPGSLPPPRLYRIAATMRFDPGARFSVGPPADERPCFVLHAGIEGLNWVTAPPGTPIGHFRGAARGPRVLAVGGEDCSAHWLRRVGDELVLVRDTMLAMMTRDPDVIRSDCLCYLLEPMQA